MTIRVVGFKAISGSECFWAFLALKWFLSLEEQETVYSHELSFNMAVYSTV